MNSGKEKNILIGVDDSEDAERAVKYVADLLGGLPGFTVTLLHIVPAPPEDYFFSDEDLGKWAAEHRTAAIGTVENYRQLLIGSGFPEDRVAVMIETRYCPSVGECILDVQRNTGSGTIVIGRKNIPRRQEFLFGSTSDKLLHSLTDCAVWLVE
ncbi:MAG: universal stress protein [Candidatus Sulfobium sp.]|jgi:nucleotide-binding universal stress UspA family protein